MVWCTMLYTTKFHWILFIVVVIIAMFSPQFRSVGGVHGWKEQAKERQHFRFSASWLTRTVFRFLRTIIGLNQLCICVRPSQKKTHTHTEMNFSGRKCMQILYVELMHLLFILAQCNQKAELNEARWIWMCKMSLYLCNMRISLLMWYSLRLLTIH